MGKKSQGLVKCRPYFPVMTPTYASFPPNETSSLIEFISERYRRVTQIESVPFSLGTTDVVESVIKEQIYSHIQSLSTILFSNVLAEQARLILNESKNVSQFIIIPEGAKGNTVPEVQADRFIMMYYGAPDHQMPYVVMVPVFSTAVSELGSNAHIKRKFYYHLATEGVATVFMYDRTDGMFFVPEDRPELGPIIRMALVSAAEQCISPQEEFPVAAAAYLDGMVFWVPRPGRHSDILQSEEWQHHRAKATLDPEDVMGFMTNHGNFVHRYRAMHMAALHHTFSDVLSNRIQMDIRYSKMRTVVDKYTPLMHHFGGILQDQENGRFGYAVRDIALFSEDLW